MRVRPLLPREVEEKEGLKVLPVERRVVITDEEKNQERVFLADAVIDSRHCQIGTAGSLEACDAADVAQAEVFEAVGADLVSRAVEGYDTCLMAYGHTGSGKTYTMLGEDWLEGGPAAAKALASSGESTPCCLAGSQMDPGEQDVSGAGAGLIPRCLAAVFAALKQDPNANCVASFYEIHNERIRDLLAPIPLPDPTITAWQDGGSGGQPRSGQLNRSRRVTVHFHPRFGAFIDGVEEMPCETLGEALRLLALGMQARTTAPTALNERSSRSHAVFTLRIEREAASNSLTFVDLAGREQERLTMCRTERLKELTLINRSLFHLAHCVRALVAPQGGPAPRDGSSSARDRDIGSTCWHFFRNSKLTMVLGHALAGPSHTAVVGTISPARGAWEDSLTTLRFCESLKQVRTRPALPAKGREDVVKELQDEVRRLEVELLRARSGRVVVERELNETQAMMEHYRESWQQAIQDGTQERRRPDGLKLYDPVASGASQSSLSTVRAGSSTSADPSSPRESSISGASPVTEAGTGGMPFQHSKSGGFGGTGSGSSSPRKVPPLPLSLVCEEEASTTSFPKAGVGVGLLTGCSPTSSSSCSPSNSPVSTPRGQQRRQQQKLPIPAKNPPQIEVPRESPVPPWAPPPISPIGSQPQAKLLFNDKKRAPDEFFPSASSVEQNPGSPVSPSSAQSEEDLLRMVEYWLLHVQEKSDESLSPKRATLLQTLRQLRMQLSTREVEAGLATTDEANIAALAAAAAAAAAAGCGAVSARGPGQSRLRPSSPCYGPPADAAAARWSSPTTAAMLSPRYRGPANHYDARSSPFRSPFLTAEASSPTSWRWGGAGDLAENTAALTCLLQEAFPGLVVEEWRTATAGWAGAPRAAAASRAAATLSPRPAVSEPLRFTWATAASSPHVVQARAVAGSAPVWANVSASHVGVLLSPRPRPRSPMPARQGASPCLIASPRPVASPCMIPPAARSSHTVQAQAAPLWVQAVPVPPRAISPLPAAAHRSPFPSQVQAQVLQPNHYITTVHSSLGPHTGVAMRSTIISPRAVSPLVRVTPRPARLLPVPIRPAASERFPLSAALGEGTR